MTLAVSLVCTFYYGKTILEQQTTAKTNGRTTAAYVLQPGSHGTAAYSGGRAETPGSRRRPAPSRPPCSSPPTAPTSPAPGARRGRGTLDEVIDLGILSGSLNDLLGDALALGATTPRVRLAQPATREPLARRRHPATLRVAATFARAARVRRDPAAAGPRGADAAHPLDDTVFVKPDPGLSPRARPAARAARRGEPYGGGRPPARATEPLQHAAQRQSFDVYVLLGLIAAFCALALVNATACRSRYARETRAAAAHRRRQRQVRAMVRAETLITLTFGLAIGTIIALPGPGRPQPRPHRLGVPRSRSGCTAHWSPSTHCSVSPRRLPTRAALRGSGESHRGARVGAGGPEAEREGFEPSRQVIPVQAISSRSP